MTDETILYISDETANNDSVLAALKATGYEVVNTNSSTQAIALLFFQHSIAGVVLNHRARERARFDIARSLRAIRSDIPIVLPCRGPDRPLAIMGGCLCQHRTVARKGRRRTAASASSEALSVAHRPTLIWKARIPWQSFAGCLTLPISADAVK
jgi:hypothetical protein